MTSRLPSYPLRVALLVAGVALTATPVSSKPVEPAGDPVDLVIALDTSGTMRALIDTARVKIWEIINDLAAADPTPLLRVGVVTYGNQIGSPADGWVRVEADLTDDLDHVSERLFALRVRGANEYVGRALQTSIESLNWSASDDALMLLFLAGNEPPGQDPYVGYEEMSELARDRGILLNAVFCGRPESEDAIGWKQMADLAEGQFATIDHSLPPVMTKTPVDRQLVELGELMNQTYVPYGAAGKAKMKSRARQDSNARKQGLAVAATRAITKASPVYSTAGDLVTAHEDGRVDVLSMAASELPRSMRRLTLEERLAFLEDMSEIRKDLRERIVEAATERHRIVAARAEPRRDNRTFDRLVRTTIRDRAQEAGFYFPKE
ncbi:MAG: VWA domain-containing protein [Thermoanaerobaculia bacterium]